MLKADGWIVYKKNAMVLTLENLRYHHRIFIITGFAAPEDEITINIAKIDNYEFKSIQAQVNESFSILLPNFEGEYVIESLSIKQEILTFTLKVKDEVKSLWLDKLIDDGYVLVDGQNSHLGTYIKNGIKITYHESHDKENMVDFTISNR